MTGATFDARKRNMDSARSTGMRMREARARLTGISGGISFDYELLNLFVSSQLKSAFALPILALVVAASCLYWAETASVAIWLTTIAVTQAIQLVLCRQFCSADPQNMNVEEWGRKIAASEFLMSATWASLVYVASDATGTLGHIFVIGVLVIVAAIRMSIASSYTLIVYASMAPITIAFVMHAAIRGEIILWAMAVFALAAEVYCLHLSRNLQSTARTMLDYRAQKDALIAELEQANVNSIEARKRAEQASAAKSHFLPP